MWILRDWHFRTYLLECAPSDPPTHPHGHSIRTGSISGEHRKLRRRVVDCMSYDSSSPGRSVHLLGLKRFQKIGYVSVTCSDTYTRNAETQNFRQIYIWFWAHFLFIIDIKNIKFMHFCSDFALERGQTMRLLLRLSSKMKFSRRRWDLQKYRALMSSVGMC